MHFYPFNIGDYATATAHLEPLEDIAYRRLMDLYYSTEKPIPECLNKTARLIRMRTHSDCIAIVLEEFFTLEDDGYHCDRIDVELFKFHEKSEKASKSAKARWKKAKKKQKVTASSERNANALKEHSDSNAKQEPINNKQETVTTKEIDNLFDSFWDLYGKKTSRAKCEPKFNKLSQADKDKIFEVLPDYIASTPDKKYRKDPSTWLNGKCWNDEIQKQDNLSGDCGIDFEAIAVNFNKSMDIWEHVPVVTKVTDKQKGLISILVTDHAMTNERFEKYFEYCATSGKHDYVLNNEKIPAQGLTYFLSEDTIQK